MKYILSVLVPGIRPTNWKRLYDSIGASCKYTWEVIFISPYALPEELKGKENVQWIEDWGTPIRCQQRGLISARGDWIAWAADDGQFLPGALTLGFDIIKGKVKNTHSYLMGKYLEGTGDNGHMLGDNYYTLSRHKASFSPWLPPHYLMLNVGLVPKKLLAIVGGWDCQFEACPMAYNDLAIRLQNLGCTVYIQNEVMFICGHTPLKQGDHGPVHDGQTLHDEPLFKDIYSRQECIDRTRVDLGNWEKTPKRWERRFGA